MRNFDTTDQCSDQVRVCDPGTLSDVDYNLPYLVPLFTPRNRKQAAAEAETLGFANAATLIDPTAIVASTCALNPGCYINAGTVIGAACNFGTHVTINRGCSIGHHNNLGDFVSIGPGCVTCGNITIGSGTMIGAGSVLLPGVTIGANSVIGAGSVVVRDVPANTRVIMKRDVMLTPLNAS